MNYLNNSSQWEEFFIQEALELEEKMKTLSGQALNKSKIRLGLENQILDWAKYESWYMSILGCCSLKSSLSNQEIEKFIEPARLAKEAYSFYEFWSEDLIPFLTWDNQLIVIGIQYNEKLVSLGHHTFILAPPRLLAHIIQCLSQGEKSTAVEEFVLSGDADSGNEKSNNELDENSDASLEGINLNVEAPKFSFNLIQPLNSPGKAPPPIDAKAAVNEVLKKEPIQNAKKATPPVSSTPLPPLVAVATPPSVAENTGNSMFNSPGDATEGLWEFISERHQEYSFEIKKQFDAFVVLKVNSKKTQVFKMDADLTRQGVNHMIFEYNLEADGPFKIIFDSGKSDTFSMKQLEMYLSDFQQACITPLKRGQKTVGFFVGFKKGALSQKDKVLLEELAEESAS